MAYKLGSLFDGSGGFPLAGAMCGIEPVWAAEVEPYPIAVTRSRFPNMKHLGDISKINGAEIEPVDIITFGSPCQDLSVAGLRKGLKHEAVGDEETTRSGLFMEAVRIIKEMRSATNGVYPRFALWENVPGAFSSNKGEDFRIVCEELIKIIEPRATMPSVPQKGWPYADSYCGDGWSLAYRVFDAQYWGVPQRRRRIHLCISFVADSGAQSAKEILFERNGLRGYFEKGRTPWQDSAADAQDGSGATDPEGESQRGRVDAVKPYTMVVRSGKEKDANGRAAGKGALVQTDKASTINTVQDQYLSQPVASSGEVAGTLDASYYKGCGMRQGVEREYVIEPVGVLASSARNAEATDGSVSPCLMARAGTGGNQLPLVAYSFDPLSSNSMKSKNPNSGCREVQVSKTLDCFDPNPSKNQGGLAIIESIVLDDQGGSRISVRDDGKVPTLRAESHGHVPAVIEPKCYDARGKGNGLTAAVTGDHNNRVTDYTSVVVEPVVYNGENVTSPANQTDPQPGDPCHTLSKDSRNYVIEPAPICLDRAFFNQGQNAAYPPQLYTDGTVPPLVARGPAAVAHSFAMQAFGQYTESDKASSLKQRDYKDATDLVVSVQYIVRRLTPTECARLQGFADWWGDIEQEDVRFTEEDYAFWLNVRNTHAALNGKAVKEYTWTQMLTWYCKLKTDSAMYKMWGNGIALPPALYCMQGIADALTAEEDDSWMM